MDEPITDRCVFEGLFELTLQPKGAFAKELTAVGYDGARQRLLYPTRVLLAALDVAHRHVYPAVPREEAHRELGRRFASHYFDTILGKVTRTLVRTLGTERFLMRLPRVVPLTSTGIETHVEQLAPGTVRLVLRGESLAADFIAGALEGGAKAVEQELRAEVVRRQPGEYELRLTWLTPGPPAP